MPYPALFVTTAAFDRAIDSLVANFDPYYPAERLGDLEALCRRVFTTSGPLGDAPRDDLLEAAIGKLIDHRTERGMPRVAEIRQVLDAEREADAMYRSTKRILADLREAEGKADERRNGR
jgi:hypothetical protein